LVNILLKSISDRYNDSILSEALLRFGFSRDSLQPLEGSTYVYQGLKDNQSHILKIVPGVWNTSEQVTGSTREQLLAEIDFVLYLAKNDLPVALPVWSKQGEWVEVFPLDDQTCFLAYCFEMVPGIIFPDDDEVHFPDTVLVEWGRMSGRLNKLSARFQPDPGRQRLPWYKNDLENFHDLIPNEQTQVIQRHEEINKKLLALPQDSESYGLVHGDFHHGNFFVDYVIEGSIPKITLFDFDAAEYFWFASEMCVALINCLPLPQSNTAHRREYTLHFLHHFLSGYRLEKPFNGFWLDQIPLFLKHYELQNYAYYHKYWDISHLSEHHDRVLKSYRQRIEGEIPVVEFKPGDLSNL
jgi:Ser/Thr protein kinase RdoA (MazF antagonist)